MDIERGRGVIKRERQKNKGMRCEKKRNIYIEREGEVGEKEREWERK